jgi:hypothetical protein
MKTIALATVGLALCSATAFAQNTTNVPSDRANPPLTRQVEPTTPTSPNAVPSQAQNPMPGTSGGFNNDQINGKSRNPDSTTPGTGPANANPKASQ